MTAFWPLLHLKAFLSEFWHNSWINLLCWDQTRYSRLEVMATLRAIRVTDLFLSWGCFPFKDLNTPKDSDAYQISALSIWTLISAVVAMGTQAMTREWPYWPLWAENSITIKCVFHSSCIYSYWRNSSKREENCKWPTRWDKYCLCS